MATTVNVNVDDRTMRQSDTLCDKLGMDACAAFLSMSFWIMTKVLTIRFTIPKT